ncbi:hypothetical protein BH23ACT7_BH23ACT7_21610 [soil metagenome]
MGLPGRPHAGIDALRARARRERLLRAVSPPRAVADASLRAEIAAALASLPPKLREAVVLVEVFGFTHREVAGILEVPEGTVKSRVFRARGRLAAWLAESERVDAV